MSTPSQIKYRGRVYKRAEIEPAAVTKAGEFLVDGTDLISKTLRLLYDMHDPRATQVYDKINDLNRKIKSAWIAFTKSR